jgi:hypothetical protein
MRYLCLFLGSVAALSGPAYALDAPSQHPRPDWTRPWLNLNGPWRFAFDPEDAGIRDGWAKGNDYIQTITVPYPWQSPLSGIARPDYQGIAWYERDITLPAELPAPRVFLVFGAVDWHATVYINGEQVAEHDGGYTPFELELTSLVKPGETARVTVRAVDTTDPEVPTGKQTGWYTPTGGIWQTVYLDFRGTSYLQQAHVSPDIDAKQATFDCVVNAEAAGDYEVAVCAQGGGKTLNASGTLACVAGENKLQVVLPVPEPALWSPDSPNLYTARLELRRDGMAVDTVDTYFGMRKISRGTYNGSDFEYILLNNKPIYLKGALHQSFNPQGIYTHPSDDFLRRDYEKAKEFGLNYIRIHIKVEEPRALYWADKLGVMLMCDMPNYTRKTDRSKKTWEQTLRAAVARDFNHPSVIAWCDFNETWGIGDGGYDRATQQWVVDMYKLTKQLDPTRLVEDNSPCTYDHTESDINSWHFYIDNYEQAKKHINEVVEKTFPGSAFNYTGDYRQGTAPLMNSEYGGVSAGGGDRDVGWCFLYLTNLLRSHSKICGYVYTELEDIEWEHNGFMNYDRSLKCFPYPGGITLADLQAEDFPALDVPPYQEVQAGAAVSVPVLFSHWTEREGLTLRITAVGETVDGRPWSQWISCSERPLQGKPYFVTPQEAYAFTAPDAAGILNLVFEIVKDGRRVGANYCVFNVRGAAWNGPGQYAVSFPPSAFASYTFKDNLGELPDPEGPAKVYGHGVGAIEYHIQLPADLKPEAIQGCRLFVEQGPKADRERVDWPSHSNPQDCPQTDGRKFWSQFRITLNDAVVAKDYSLGDCADVSGVLSHVTYFQHGSHGCMPYLLIEGDALNALKDALAKGQPLRIKFEVPADAAHKGGLAIYGHNMGMWPSDPTLLFTLSGDKPKGEAKAVDLVSDRIERIVRRGPDGHAWRYTFEKPADDWASPAFDDSKWPQGLGGFGTEGTPGARIGTKWDTPNVWLRTTVTIPDGFGQGGAWIDLHHDEDVQVFVNGQLLLSRKRYATDYSRIALAPEQIALFKPGEDNVVALHCQNTGGGQFVDLALSTVK